MGLRTPCKLWNGAFHNFKNGFFLLEYIPMMTMPSWSLWGQLYTQIYDLLLIQISLEMLGRNHGASAEDGQGKAPLLQRAILMPLCWKIDLLGHTPYSPGQASCDIAYFLNRIGIFGSWKSCFFTLLYRGPWNPYQGMASAVSLKCELKAAHLHVARGYPY